MKKSVAVLWEKGPVKGRVVVVNGKLHTMGGRRSFGKDGAFRIAGAEPCRLDLSVDAARLQPGSCPTMVRIVVEERPFAFFLRDVRAESPLYIPEYAVVVTDGADARTWADIVSDIRAKGLVSQEAAIAAEPEETYENACRHTRKLMCPTWLGLGRDMRFFEVGYNPQLGYWGYVQPRYHSTLQSYTDERGKQFYAVAFVIGPGASCRYDIERRLEEGALPILHATQREDAVQYHLTAFCSLEKGPVSAARLRGSEWQACYPNTGGNMLQKEEVAALKDILDAEMRRREEETICWIRVEAVNTDRVPRYAWFKLPGIQVHGGWRLGAPSFDPKTGFGVMKAGDVFAISKLNGEPAPDEELAVLIQPGGRALLEMIIPHQPVSRERAERLAQEDLDEHLDGARKFWRSRLASAASISVPEAAIAERIQAGLLHCDIAALGREPDGPVLATIGWYAPIGSESSPIIQFFDSMGWHKLAERSLDFFLARQREDGFIQNFGGYQLETGPALWTMGEHYRYTRDDAWVRRIKPNVLKACEYLLAWRERNKREDLRGKGYGLQNGKVADPEDFFHSFMLNGLSYIGIQRASEMLARVDPAASRRLAKEAREYREDIRTAYREAVARSPAIPLGDGTWVPTFPPWAEHAGPVSLYAEGGKWFTHGAFGSRDSLIGPLYLVISEVLEPRERLTDFLIRGHQQLFTVRNAGLSQPYYCRHDHVHIVRDEVKAFLKTYYNQFSALQDRETYTFWEHYHHVSQHKTHEEGWFLMQTRWMLWMEEGDTLKLLRAIPRRWMEDGKRIELRNAATYFGPISLSAESRLSEGRIEACASLASARRPAALTIRLPHPEGRRPVAVEGGCYDSATEAVRIEKPGVRCRVRLRF